MKQSPNLIVKGGGNVILNCSQISTTHNGMYWFWQKLGKPLEMIVYSYVTMTTVEEPLQEKFFASRQGSTLQLTLLKAQHTDSALFFCAKQDAQWCRLLCTCDKK